MTRARALAMLVASAVTGYVVGELAAPARRVTRGADSLAQDVERFGMEQAALRRVATLVARAAAPEEVFAAVTAEVGRLLGTEYASSLRYEPDGAATWVGAWTSTEVAFPVPVGTRVALGGRNVLTLVSETGRPVRIDDYSTASGPVAETHHRWGVRAAVGVPINVEGRLWGLVLVASTRARPLPADTEARLAGFTELVATALANAQARVELRGFAEEQAALRRVATLVARAAAPEEVFAAVTAEVGRVLHAEFITMTRYDPDGGATILGAWSSTTASPIKVGTRYKLGGRNVTTLVFETGRPARIDDYTTVSGDAAYIARAFSFGAAAAVPINVAGRLWGLMGIASTRVRPLPADTEARLAGFTELAATAVANAESQAQLTASRARIVAAADQARRRIERDLHDGAQQRLVSLAMALQLAQAAAPPEAVELAAQLDDLAAEATSTLDELRELARGIHPAALAEGGLSSALEVLARRCTIPVRLDVRADRQLPEPIEVAAYYVVAEALTNAVKHAHASTIDVQVDTAAAGGDADALRVCARDDGRGGADLSGGSGLVGLKDRVEALGGRLWVRSVCGAGTTVQAELPLGPARGL
ncbi:GAF domain-containing sensor histidine kinase [Pseudonocardia sp. CA-142604]|uniref:GAF domain-containing sensor histidine kinase n=1 Tax=Pseudonocardia sp. CA-142604 TaxID=3240024 RepID=UPI003D933F7A